MLHLKKLHGAMMMAFKKGFAILLLTIPVMVCSRSSSYVITNQEFRDGIVGFVETGFKNFNSELDQKINGIDKRYNMYFKNSDWTLNVTCYADGQIAGTGKSQNPNLVDALEDALKKSVVNVKNRKDCRYKFDFIYYPVRHYSFISYGKTGLEMTGNRVAIRSVTRDSVNEQVQRSTHYLLRSMDPKYHGFYKYYDAADNKAEGILRTIYSSSSLYSLINIHNALPQLKLDQYFKPIAKFILAQQLLTGPHKGAFYYSFDPKTGKNSPRIVVGTTSKTIFTLIKLNEFFPEDKTYINQAKLAGDWLAQQVQDDGQVIPVYTLQHGAWIPNKNQSLLYSGQVLSALSRLYEASNKSIYKEKAKRIAHRFLEKIKNEGTIIGDDYRPANSISSSWALMSLLDYSKIDPNPEVTQVMQQIAYRISNRQHQDYSDLYYLGNYYDALSTSGNGWINEVFGEYYQWCVNNKAPDCERYKKAMILTSRWLIQNSYTLENAFQAKDPQRALGGFIRRYNDQLVRTDAVCHGVNSLLSLLLITKSDNPQFLDIKEEPLEAILLLLRIGKGDFRPQPMD